MSQDVPPEPRPQSTPDNAAVPTPPASSAPVATTVPAKIRPWNVTLVAVLGIILTISGLATSLLAIFAAGSAAARYDVGATKGTLITIGVVGAIWAIVMFLLWLRFLKGSRASRAWLAVFVVLHIVLGIGSSSVTGGTSGLFGAIFVSAFEIVVLFLMFAGHRTAEFFAKTN